MIEKPLVGDVYFNKNTKTMWLFQPCPANFKNNGWQDMELDIISYLKLIELLYRETCGGEN